jgi:hypothetical protein
MKFFILFLFILVSYASSLAQTRKVDFNWLVGTWKMNLLGGANIESWEQVNENLYKGKSVRVKGKDSTLQETLEISKKDTVWYYTSTVVNQNNNQPISFKIIYTRPGEFISENPAHDFPQRIAYRRYQSMFMHATIEGNNKGRYSKRNFDFYQEDKNELFSYTVTPTPGFANALATDTIIQKNYKKHQWFIDSLGYYDIVLFSGSNNVPPQKQQPETVVLKAMDIDKAKAIIARDPAILSGTHKGELVPFTINSWFPGNYGRQ